MVGRTQGLWGNGGKEKDITLAVAKLVGAKIRRAHPEVNVLYTRTTDVFVGLQYSINGAIAAAIVNDFINMSKISVGAGFFFGSE